jgi:hypothetical protein
MGYDTDTLQASAEDDEDLITLFYLLTLLICLIMGQSACVYFYVIALLSVADVVCNL